MKNILSLQLPVEKGDYDKLPADFYKTQTSQTDEIGFWRSSWRRLRENKIAMVSLVIILAIIVFAVLGPLSLGRFFHPIPMTSRYMETRTSGPA